MVQSHSDCRTGKAGCASANGVNDDHHCAFGVADGFIDFLGCSGFHDAEARQILSHGFDQKLWIWHAEECSTGSKHGIYPEFRPPEVAIYGGAKWTHFP